MNQVAIKKLNYLVLIFSTTLLLSACSVKPTMPAVEQAVAIPPGNMLFFSKSCAHCAIVEQYITDNNIHQKLYFVEREITTDQEAYKLMPIIGQRCNINEQALGVPLFWDGNKCYSGDETIINYFKSLP